MKNEIRRQISKKTRLSALSLMELMVGLLVLMVGMVGLASMMTLQYSGKKSTREINEAATLMQSKIENMQYVVWTVLGTDNAAPAPNGLTSAGIYTEGPLNRIGLSSALGGTGPFSYYRHTVVCNPGDTTAAGASPSYCGNDLSGAKRPAELACSSFTLGAKEKIVRVMVTWTERDGRCKHIETDAMSYNWAG